MSSNARIEWQEPTAYRKAMLRQSSFTNPWKQVAVAALVFGGLIAFRAFQGWWQPNRAPTWPVAVSVDVAAAWFFAYFVPWLQVSLPGSIVILSEKGVNNNVTGHGVRVQFFPWDIIGRIVATTNTFEGTVYPVIALYSHDGQLLITLGLPKSPSIDQIGAFVELYGKSLCRQPE